MTKVEGKNAFVTGGASGIGGEIVRQLVAQGAKVVAVDRNEGALAALAAEVGCDIAAIDVTSPDANRSIVERCQANGGVDYAFLNAGILGRAMGSLGDPYAVIDLDLDRYRQVMAVNTDAVVFGTVAAAEAMASSGGGAIVATASTAGLVGWPSTPMYCASKHAVVGWVRGIADSLAADNITINAICPGGVATPLVGRSPDDAGNEEALLRPSTVAAAAIATAVGGGTGHAVSVVAGREPVVQNHDFNSVPGFP